VTDINFSAICFVACAASFSLLGSPSRSRPAALIHKLIELCLVPCGAQVIYKTLKLSLFILHAPKGVDSIFVEGRSSRVVGIVSRSHQLAPHNEQGCNKRTDKQQRYESAHVQLL
jgi:hypothetical protein